MCALVAAIAAGAFLSTQAFAYSTTYCQQSMVGGGTCQWTYHHVESNTAYNVNNYAYKVCAGAKDADGSNHGNFYCGPNGVSPSVYLAGDACYAAIHNGETFGQSMKGIATG
jgi:hypothetical protein